MVKIKNRYYIIRMITNDGSEPDVRKGQIFQEIIRHTSEMFGDYGYSLVKMSLSVRVIDEDVIVMRVAAAGEKFVSAIIPCVLKVGNQPMILNTLFTGRSMRSCEKRLIEIRREELHSKLRTCTNPAERTTLLTSIRDICGKPGRIFDESIIKNDS